MWSRILPQAALGLAGIVAYRELLLLPKSGAADQVLVFWLLEPGCTWPPLVAAGSWWLFRRRAGAWGRLPLRSGPPLWGAALAALGAGFFAWARLSGASDLLVPSLMANALGLACWVRGAAGGRVALGPVLFLLFAWPLPPPLLNQLVWPLQLWTAEAAGAFLGAVGVPALVETTVVTRPDGVFAVIENCSGFRVVELLAAVAWLLRERVPGGGARSWIPLLVAPPLALLLNLLRVFAVVASPDPDAVNDHLVQGLVMLGGGTLALWGLASRLGGAGRGAPRPAPRAAASAPGLPRLPGLLAGALALAALSLLPAPRPGAGQAPVLPGRIPVEHAGWVARGVPPDPLFLGTVRFGESLSRLYTRGDERVVLFVGRAAAADRRTSPFSPKTLLPGMGWRLEQARSVRLDELGIEAESAVVERDGRRWLVYHWHRGDAGWIGESLRHGLAMDRVPLARRERAVLRLATPLGPGRPDARERGAERLEGFARDFRDFLGAPWNGGAPA